MAKVTFTTVNPSFLPAEGQRKLDRVHKLEQELAEARKDFAAFAFNLPKVKAAGWTPETHVWGTKYGLSIAERDRKSGKSAIEL